MRLVREHRGVPEEERFVAISFQEVIDRLISLPADLQTHRRHAGRLSSRVAMRHPCREAPFAEIPFPPFAALKASVPRFAEIFGSLPCGDVLEHLAAVGSLRRIVSCHQMLMRILPADDRHQARPAEACRHVSAREQQAFLRQPIEVRRLDMLDAP